MKAHSPSCAGLKNDVKDVFSVSLAPLRHRKINRKRQLARCIPWSRPQLTVNIKLFEMKNDLDDDSVTEIQSIKTTTHTAITRRITSVLWTLSKFNNKSRSAFLYNCMQICTNTFLYTVSQKQDNAKSCPCLRQVLTDLQNSFTGRLSRKFAIKCSSHLKSVAQCQRQRLSASRSWWQWACQNWTAPIWYLSMSQSRSMEPPVMSQQMMPAVRQVSDEFILKQDNAPAYTAH